MISINHYIDSHLDKGCQFSPKCLDCPLPLSECPLQNPDRRLNRKDILHGEAKKQRDAEVVLLWQGRVKIKDIAERFDVTRQWIDKILRKNGVLVKGEHEVNC